MTEMPSVRKLKPEVRTLDKDACENLGHVAHVSGPGGLSAMFRAIAAAPVNAVIWPDAGADMDDATLAQLRTWRDDNNFSNFIIQRNELTTHDKARERITGMFNGYAAKTGIENPALDALRDHILRRITAMESVLPGSYINVQVRAIGTVSAKTTTKPHVDGNNGTAQPRVLRFLESIASDGTLIYANDDFDIGKTTSSHDGLRVWGKAELNRTKGVAAWQAPPNALLVISNDMHHCKPVLHSEPPVVKGRTESNRRIVVCYDVSPPAGWMPKPA